MGFRAWGHLGLGPRCGTGSMGQYKTHDVAESVGDGLWRLGGAFFQIGLGCVISHHLSPHRRALYIPILILAGKFKMELLPTVSHCQQLVTEKGSLWNRFVQTRIKLFPAI